MVSLYLRATQCLKPFPSQFLVMGEHGAFLSMLLHVNCNIFPSTNIPTDITTLKFVWMFNTEVLISF